MYTEINYCNQVEPLVGKNYLILLIARKYMHDSINFVLLFLFVKKHDATPSGHGVRKESSFFHKRCVTQII